MQSRRFETPRAVPISVFIKRAESWPLAASDRAVVATEAPLNAKRRAIASPIPFVPPVTRTRLPLNSSPKTVNGIVIAEFPSFEPCLGRLEAREFRDHDTPRRDGPPDRHEARG